MTCYFHGKDYDIRYEIKYEILEHVLFLDSPIPKNETFTTGQKTVQLAIAALIALGSKSAHHSTVPRAWHSSIRITNVSL